MVGILAQVIISFSIVLRCYWLNLLSGNSQTNGMVSQIFLPRFFFYILTSFVLLLLFSPPSVLRLLHFFFEQLCKKCPKKQFATGDETLEN